MGAAMGLSIHNSNINLHLIAGVFLGTGVLLGGVAFLHPFSTETSYATNSNVSVGYSGSDWVITAPTSTAADAGGLTFDIEGNPAGVNMAKKDTVTSGGTNVPDYQIYVSVDTEGGKIPATSGDAAIAATSGTVTDATGDVSGAAALSNNSWGFALPSFNTGINYDDLVSSSSSSSWASSKWSKLPYVATTSIEDESTIESTATKIYDSTTSTADSVDVYYAVNANNDLASGEYQATVTYTLIGEMPEPPVTYMQDMDASSCAALDIYDPTNATTQANTTYTVVDKRDNQEYKIRRLYMNTKNSSSTACWMVENLRLTGAKTLTKDDTNLDTSFTLKASDTSTWCTIDSSYCDDQSMMIDAHTSTYPESYLYNWYAATAGTGTYSDSSTSSAVEASICPGKGANTTTWHLPSGNTNGEWYYLFNAYKDDYSWSNISGSGNTTTNNLSTTIGPNFVYSGYRNGSSTLLQSNSGYWWSRTAVSNYVTHDVSLNNNGYVGGGTHYSNKYYGFAVRCVLPAS